MGKEIPKDRLFSTEHEWVLIDSGLAKIGITDHAQHALGDVVYVELPQTGSLISQGRPIGVVESVKAVSDIYAPLSGIVTEVNMKIIEQPELINKDPYGDGWMLKVELKNDSEQKRLLDKSSYEELLKKEAK